jgi:hypothetical protein
MTWTCPHQIKDNFCGLRKKRCEPLSVGCVLSKQFTFVGDEINTELDKNRRKQNNKK